MQQRANVKPKEKTYRRWYSSQTRMGPEGGLGSKWNFPFCFYFTNQAGTVILSFVGMTLMFVTLLVNIYSLNHAPNCTKIVQCFLLYLYLAIMITGFVAAFVGAYNEMSVISQIAAYIVAVGTAIFFIFFIISLSTSSIDFVYVCPEMRCPDHHWLQESGWRGKLDHSGRKNQINSTTESPQNVSRIGYSDILLDNRGCDIHLVSEDHSWYLILASAIFTLMILAFFVYSVITFYAYGRYLKSTKH